MTQQTAVDPAFAANASLEAVRAQYERAEQTVTLCQDRARALFVLLCQREDEAAGVVR